MGNHNAKMNAYPYVNPGTCVYLPFIVLATCRESFKTVAVWIKPNKTSIPHPQ